MSNWTRLFFMTLWMLFALIASNAIAQVTEDSATWEGSYEADFLPVLAGWTAGVGDPAWVSVSDGILSYDTMQLAATGGATTNGGAFWYRANPGFDFVAGASIEVRMRLNDIDIIATPTFSCIVEVDQAAEGMCVNPLVQTYAETGTVNHVGVPLGTWTTIRVVAQGNVFRLYPNVA